jgi:hypothetical protein
VEQLVTKFVGMANDSPFCTADTYDEAYRGVFDIAYKLGWLGPKIKIAARIWVEEVPHLGGSDSE